MILGRLGPHSVQLLLAVWVPCLKWMRFSNRCVPEATSQKCFAGHKDSNQPYLEEIYATQLQEESSPLSQLSCRQLFILTATIR